jgi:hypothetical protein
MLSYTQYLVVYFHDFCKLHGPLLKTDFTRDFWRKQLENAL